MPGTVDKKRGKVDAKYMQKGKIVLGFVGLLLATAGIVLFNFGQPATKTAAQTGYTSNWQASKLYRLHLSNGSQADLGAIGVSEWSVTGTIGSTSFTETWKGPTASSAVVSANTNNNCNSNGYDKTKWLVACTSFDFSGPIFSLLEATPSSVFSDNSVSYAGGIKLGWSGGGSVCNNFGQGAQDPPTINGCVFTSGAYAFGYANQQGGLRMAGLMMPLQWTVTGTVQ